MTSRRPQGLNDKTFTKGVPTDRLRLTLNERRAGWHEAVVPPSAEGIRAAIESQICPWCGKGPFKMLPVHTNKVHAVDKYELRDLAGLTTNDPVCSTDALGAMSAAARRPGMEERVERAASAARGRPKGDRRWTAAGKGRLSDNLRQWVAEHPEEAQETRLRANRAANAPEVKARRAVTQAAIQRERWAAMTPEERARRSRHLLSPDAKAARAAARLAALQPCGTRASYKRGCRCNACRDAKAEYERQRVGYRPEGAGVRARERADRLSRAGVTAADVRAWATDNGFDVGARGVPGDDITDAFLAASHGQGGLGEGGLVRPIPIETPRGVAPPTRRRTA